MEELIHKLADTVGIDRPTAETVMASLNDHARHADELRSSAGLDDKLPGELGDKPGGLI